MTWTHKQGDVLILGAGPAGMAAAIVLAEALGRGGRPPKIFLAEKLPKPGKKLLATGNGRCNLSNRAVSAQGYVTQSPRRLEEILEALPFERLRAFWERHGLLCSEEPDGRLYPHSYFAGTVVEVLRQNLARLGVEEVCGFEAAALSREQGRFVAVDRDGRRLEAGMALLAAGGRASPALGADGSGFALAQNLGHRLTPLWPGLTAFVSPSPLCAGLKGVRAFGRASLYRRGCLLAAEEGEIQFAGYGLSGIPFFQLSLRYGMACPAGDGEFSARVDLFPHKSQRALAAWLAGRGALGLSAGQALEGAVHWKLAQAALKAADLSPAARVTAETADRLAGVLKGLSFPLSGTLGWEHCQVTGGGVSLQEVDPSTMASQICPGLYLAGEVLDAAGLCGGYNLHWAFGTGLLAGQGMARALKGGHGAEKRDKAPRPGPGGKKRRKRRS